MESQEALRPLASLISKSEKAREKLAPGTWQHTMLQDNLKALRLGVALMTGETADAKSPRREDLDDALRAFSSMIGKAEKAQAKFVPGTAQHTLQRNRLEALRAAEAAIRAEAGKT